MSEEFDRFFDKMEATNPQFQRIKELETEVSALRLRVETAEKEAAEAYAKGQRDMRKEAAMIAEKTIKAISGSYEGHYSFSTKSCGKHKIIEAVASPPIKERP